MTYPNTDVHVSASQISTARGCMRKWAWKRVLDLPDTKEQEARKASGKAVHQVGEDYQKLGTKPDRSTTSGRAFMPALPWVPAPGQAVAELEIRLDEPPFLGYVDLFSDARHVPGEWPGCHHVILDYKTKDSFTSKSMFQGIGDFLTDPQALTYATWYFRKHPNDRIGMRWLYLRVSGKPAAKPVDVILTREQVMEAFYRLVEPLALELVQIRLRPVLDPLTLEPNPLECMRYGARYACHYISRCGLTVSQRVQGAMKMSLIDDLRNQFGPKGVNPPETSQAQDKPLPGKAGLPLPRNLTGAEAEAEPKDRPVTARAQAEKADTSRPETVPAQKIKSMVQDLDNADRSDAELGRAVRVLFKAFRG